MTRKTASREIMEEIEIFYSYLHQNGLKKTHQKDLILETFLSTEGHLSVEDIHALVRKRDRKIGIVTVFRTLKSLTACGIAREIALGDGLKRFEHSYRHPLHHHIVCTECHKAIEYACPALEQIQEEIIERYRFQPMHHNFQTYGICEDCREHRSAVERPAHDTQRVFERDAIRMAIGMQKRCLEFYREFAGRNQDPAGKGVFERMVEEEERHVAELSAKLDDLEKQEKGIDAAPMFLHFDPSDLEAMIPTVSKFEKDGELRLDARASSELVIALNIKTNAYFREYAAKFSETRGKQVFLAFADQERKHSEQLRRRLEELQVLSEKQ